MNGRVKDIPSIPANVPEDLGRVLRAMRERLQRLGGTRGDPLDAALTGRSGVGTGGSTIIIGGGSSGGSTTPDLTPPPTVTDLTVLAGFSEVIVTWTGIGYTQGHGNKQTLIYAVKKDPSDPTMPVFGDAQLVATAPHALTIISLPSELNTRWHVWAKFETNDGVLSVAAAGGTNGVQGTTAQDIAQLLEVLSGQITASQLYVDLATPIARITQISDEAAADALSAAITVYQETQARVAALLAEAEDRGTAITETRTLLQSADSALASTLVTLTATVTTNQGIVLAALQDEATARADGDSAEASERNTLAVQLRGSYTGTDLDSVSTGLIASERVARLSADGALTIAVSALESSVNTPSTGLLARATALESVTTNVTSGNTALASRASLLEASVYSPTSGNNPTYAALAVEAAVRADETGDLFGQFTVKIDLNGYVTGYGLASTSTGAAPSSMFLVRADQFAVVPPTDYTGPTAPPTPSLHQRWYDTVNGVVKRWDGTTWVVFNDLPFVVQAVPTTEGSVTIDAGVYIDAANVVNLTAQYGRFQQLVADDIIAADIQVSQLVAGTLRVGSYIQSQGFVSNTSGWRISAAGNIEANDAVLRGVIYASGGAIGGIIITASALQSTNFDGSFDSAGNIVDTGTVGWGISKSGKLVLDVAFTRDSKSMAAQDTVSVYDGAAVSSVSFEQPFAEHVGNGFAVKAGCEGYINLYLNTSAARVLEIGCYLKAVETTTLDECVGPEVVKTVHCGGGVAWAASSSYRYALPISAQWLFGGSYWTETGAMRPGTAGIPASPVQIDNFLGNGTWEIRLVLNVTCYSPGTATASAVIEDARLYLGGWKHDLPGSVAFDEPSPPGWA